MRIAFLTPMPHVVTFGGANSCIRQTAEKLAAHGHDVAVFGSLLGEGPGRLTPEDIEARQVPVTATSRGLRTAVRLNGVAYTGVEPLEEHIDDLAVAIRHSTPEVMVVAGEDTDARLLRVALRIDPGRTVVLAQTPDLLPLGPHCDLEMRDLLLRAKHLVATSRFLRDRLREDGFDNTSLVYPPIFDLPVDAENGGPGGRVLMVNPSSIKGIDTFVLCAASRPTRRFKAIPLWATREEDLDELRRLGNVSIEEPRDAADEIFRDVAVTLVPSVWTENFPLTVISSLAHGVPCITSDVGGLPESGLGVTRIAPVFTSRQTCNRPSAIVAWLRHVDELRDPAVWERASCAGRAAVSSFAKEASVAAFVAGLTEALAVGTTPP